MQINNINNTTNFNGFIGPIQKNEAKFYKYIDITNNKKAFEHWKEKCEELKYIDVFANFEKEEIQLINIISGEFVKTFPNTPQGQTGLDRIGEIKWFGQKLYNRIFHPEKLMPLNMVNALRYAQKLNAKEVAKREYI